ncbi:hypothetical protein GCG54_00010269 [Colletotrichum gloeosporioides]|uniref:DUF7580 domain-containing protein n=1 Tax=Colletotrichum gloeosporioides TaxID=474922 RepID=A0A8H4CBX5_COLGL|nr:uncharacterized protein GCG54_00010269 [Colletotrichum gloeosporioides]KAF3800992.1 hypothetical protein GCG54_00010269 [Colletotrichum gloeosporioides]
MAELALGIVGIVPLIGGAIKAYKEVNQKLKLFRHSSKEVKKTHKVLRIQRQVFANECRLWLAFGIEDDETATQMASDPEHDGWNDPSLDASLRNRLKDNYDIWLEVNAGIVNTIDSLDTSLVSFRESSDVETGALQKTLKRTEGGVKAAFTASKHEKLIEKLRASNNELKGLREQIEDIHKSKRPCSVQMRASQKGDCESLIGIRRASKALHEALMSTWRCGQPDHLGHAMKLFVEAYKVADEIKLNLAILCYNRIGDVARSTLVQLEVRSQNLEWIEQSNLPGPLPPPDDDEVPPRKRRKVVRFAETTVQTHFKEFNSATTVTLGQNLNCGSCDLRSSKDTCKELMRRLSTECLGHIDDHKAISMDEVLDDSSQAFFSTVDRLKLARCLVSAVLKFHSTPWLSDFWRLRDLAFFRTDQDEEVSDALRTLHLGVEVSQKQLNSMEDVQISSECSRLSQVSEDDRLFCGINNLMLHSLGVALLQIDRWAQVEPSDILNVRKMALRNSSLGPRYQEITQKCLRCDFGYGSDLTKPRLQEAVYENVVGALEKMISSLDLTDD